MSVEKQKKKYKIFKTINEFLIRALHSEIFPDDEFYESEGEKIYWLVQDQLNDIVGFCILSLLDDGIVFMARAGLYEGARGKGLHQRMIKVRERHARKNKFTIAITYTKIDNITSSRNLQKAGYMLYIPDYQYADADCLYWMKEL